MTRPALRAAATAVAAVAAVVAVGWLAPAEARPPAECASVEFVDRWSRAPLTTQYGCVANREQRRDG